MRPARGRPREYTDEDILGALRDFYVRFNRPPTRDEQRGMKVNGVPTRSTIVSRWGSAKRAFELAGIPTNPRGGRVIHGRFRGVRPEIRPIDEAKAAAITHSKQAFWAEQARGRHGLANWRHPYARRSA